MLREEQRAKSKYPSNANLITMLKNNNFLNLASTFTHLGQVFLMALVKSQRMSMGPKRISMRKIVPKFCTILSEL